MTGAKKALGNVGFPTPDSVPETSGCRSFLLPDNADWYGLLMGALQPLMDDERYYQWGSLTPTETAAAFAEYIEAAYNVPCGGGSDLVTVPFWESDDGSDAAVEAPAETWYDEVSWWIIEAFLASTITPGAAITFVTTTRTLHLAFKRGGFGALVDVLVDDVLQFTVDTYSAGTPVLEVVVDTGDDDEHTLKLVHTGEANEAAEEQEGGGFRMDVIRKNIRFALPSFVNLTRYDEDTDTVQTSADGGATWVDNPGVDPRHSLTQPLLETSDPRCDAAARMTAYVQELIDQMLDGLESAQTAGWFINIVLLSLPLVGVFIDIFWVVIYGFVTILINLGHDDIDDSFTSTFYTHLEGYFYCALMGTGELTAAGLAQVIAKIAANEDETCQNVFGALVGFVGEGGFNAIASTRTETGSCGSLPNCTWSHDLLPGDSHVLAVAGGIFNCSSVWRNHPVPLNVQTKDGTECWYWSLAESRRSIQLRLPLHLPAGCTLGTVLFQFRNLAGGNLDTVLKHFECNYATTVACGENGSGGSNERALTINISGEQDVVLIAYMDENAAVKDFCIDFVRISGTGIDPLLT